MLTQSNLTSGQLCQHKSLVVREAISPAVTGITDEDGSHIDNWQELAQTVIELKLASTAQAENHHQLVNNLQKKIAWLSLGWLTSLLFLGGGGLWMAYRFHTQQQKLAMQMPYVQTTLKAESAKVEQLDLQLKNLDRTLQLYQGQLGSLQTKIEQLTNTSSSVDYTDDQRQEALSLLTQALKDLVQAEELGKVESAEPITKNALEENRNW